MAASDIASSLGINEQVFRQLLEGAERTLANPVGGCRSRCQAAWFLYVAINLPLNVVAAFGRPDVRLPPFIFKVGTTQSCAGVKGDSYGRLATLNDPGPYAWQKGAGPYAGFTGWHIVGCWPLPSDLPLKDQKRYDQEVFRRWIRGVDRRERKRRAVVGVRADYLEMGGLTPGENSRRAGDLYVMEEDFLDTGRTGLAANSFHDQVLAVARSVILDAVQPLVNELVALRQGAATP